MAEGWPDLRNGDSDKVAGGARGATTVAESRWEGMSLPPSLGCGDQATVEKMGNNSATYWR